MEDAPPIDQHPVFGLHSEPQPEAAWEPAQVDLDEIPDYELDVSHERDDSRPERRTGSPEPAFPELAELWHHDRARAPRWRRRERFTSSTPSPIGGLEPLEPPVPPADVPMSEAALARREELLHVDVRPERTGTVRAHKSVTTRTVQQLVPCEVEHAEIRREPPEPNDDGKVITYPDGTISLPVLEERVVVTKQTVVVERVVIGKRSVTEERLVEADLRTEHVKIDTSDAHGRVVDAQTIAPAAAQDDEENH